MKNIIFWILLLLFVGCGGDNSEDTTISTLSVNAGESISATLDDVVYVKGNIINTDDSDAVRSIQWKECDEFLANELGFEYVPTSLGIHTLTLSALTDSGKQAEDKKRINVYGDIKAHLYIQEYKGCYYLFIQADENLTYTYTYKDKTISKEILEEDYHNILELLDDCSFQMTIRDSDGNEETLNATI